MDSISQPLSICRVLTPRAGQAHEWSKFCESLSLWLSWVVPRHTWVLKKTQHFQSSTSFCKVFSDILIPCAYFLYKTKTGRLRLTQSFFEYLQNLTCIEMKFNNFFFQMKVLNFSLTHNFILKEEYFFWGAVLVFPVFDFTSIRK